MFLFADGMLPLHYAAAWRNAFNEECHQVGEIEVIVFCKYTYQPRR
jgi:hypothetical protein